MRFGNNCTSNGQTNCTNDSEIRVSELDVTQWESTDTVLWCFWMEARCCNWYPKSKKAALGLVHIAAMSMVSYSTSTAQWLAPPFTLLHSFHSHSISSALSQRNSPSCEHSHSSHFRLLVKEEKCCRDVDACCWGGVRLDWLACGKAIWWAISDDP